MTESDVPWYRLERALRPQFFTVVRAPELDVDRLVELDQTVPTHADIAKQTAEEPQWEFIVRQLKLIGEDSHFMALRPEEGDLQMVVGRESDLTYPDEIKQWVDSTGEALSAISKAARRFQVSDEVKSEIDEMAEESQEGPEDLGNVAAIPIRLAKLVAGLVRFNGRMRCVLVVADPHVRQAEEKAWTRLSLRSRRWGLNPRGLVNAVVEAWLWEVSTGRVLDAHRGIRASFAGSPIPNLSPDGLRADLEKLREA